MNDDLTALLVELREAAKPFAQERQSAEPWPATTTMHESPAQSLRRQADEIERRDGEIERLRRAIAAAQGIVTEGRDREAGRGERSE